MNPRLVILSSPSGAGKTTIARRILAARDDVAFSISATTRPKRPRERDGVDYHFLTREEFVERRERGEFLEWAEYNGRLYGTLLADVDALLASGQHVILDIEVQGAQQVRERRTDVVAIFVFPPSGKALLGRLRGRGSEDPQEVANRVAQAGRELERAASYDHVVVNDVLNDAVAEVERIIDGEPSRVMRPDERDNRIDELRCELAAMVTPKES